MRPLMGDLPAVHRNGLDLAQWTELAAIKVVTARGGLGLDGMQVGVDGQPWRCMRTKAFQLRVISITPGLAAQYGACQKTFAPHRDQAFGVEIPGMQGPETQLISPLLVGHLE